jgi:GTPase SAR1 family protein
MVLRWYCGDCGITRNPESDDPAVCSWRYDAASHVESSSVEYRCCICLAHQGKTHLCTACKTRWTILKKFEADAEVLRGSDPATFLRKVTELRAKAGQALQYRIDLIVVNLLLETTHGAERLVELTGKHRGLRSVCKDGSRSLTVWSTDGNLDLSVSHAARLAAYRENAMGRPVKGSRSTISAELRAQSLVAQGLLALVLDGVLRSLDVSGNTDLKTLPVYELSGIASLRSIDCRGCIRLFSPPSEISRQGGRAVVEYLRAQKESKCSTSIELIFIGNGESGKTSVKMAIMSESNRSASISEHERTLGVDLDTWKPDEKSELYFNIKDLAGQSVYSLSNQFFLVKRAIYVLVWRVERGGTEKSTKNMVLTWINTLQLRIPGAIVLLVATHIDCVLPNVKELDKQKHWVKDAVESRLRSLNADNKGHYIEPLKVWNNGQSLCVQSLEGFGIEELRRTLQEMALEVPWWKEPIPAGFIHFQERIQKLARTGKNWINWEEYSKLASSSEYRLTSTMTEICTKFMHENATIKYFDSFETNKQDQKKSTVFINIRWIIDVLKGIIRHERDALISYFSSDNPGFQDPLEKLKWLRHVQRLATYGVMHEDLVPFLWPSGYTGLSKNYWEWAKEQMEGQNVWKEYMPGKQGGTGATLAIHKEDYSRILKLLAGCDILHKISDSEYVVPALLAENKQQLVDARSCEKLNCTSVRQQFSMRNFYFEALPLGFFEKLVIKCRRFYTHMDFSSGLVAFYGQGLKAQIFQSRTTIQSDGQERSVQTLECLTTTKTQLEDIVTQIKELLFFFPGVRRLQNDEDLESLSEREREREREREGKENTREGEAQEECIQVRVIEVLIQDSVAISYACLHEERQIICTISTITIPIYPF